MGYIYRWLGTDEQIKKLWQNREAIELYVARLKDFWNEENQCWLDSPKPQGVQIIEKPDPDRCHRPEPPIDKLPPA